MPEVQHLRIPERASNDDNRHVLISAPASMLGIRIGRWATSSSTSTRQHEYPAPIIADYRFQSLFCDLVRFPAYSFGGGGQREYVIKLANDTSTDKGRR